MLDPLIRSVVNLINRYGGSASLVVENGGYDPSTSSTTTTTKNYQVRLIAQDYIEKTSGITSQTGGLVRTGDKQFFIQPDPNVPVPRVGVDYIIFEGRKWTVIALKDYNPSGTKSYVYEVYARQ